MALTEKHKQLLRSSWADVKAKDGEDFGKLGTKMFVRLFEVNPEVMPTFPFATGPKEKLKDSPRLRKHGAGVLGTINVAIGGLDDMDTLAAALKDLGKRHKSYKATVPQFEPIGVALLWTIEQELGDKFTPEVKDAWLTVFATIKATMATEM